MIKNIVFDIGNVLMNFKPKEYMKKLELNQETIEAMDSIIFQSNLWKEVDRGTLLVKDLANKLARENPNYEEPIQIVLNKDWVNMHTTKEDSILYMRQMKQNGYSIYLLSNCSKEAYDYLAKYDFMQEIDGGVYSYEVQINKPEKEIYQALVEKYKLKPEESIFLDDKKENIQASIKLGFHGIIFEELEEVKRKVQQIMDVEKEKI